MTSTLVDINNYHYLILLVNFNNNMNFTNVNMCYKCKYSVISMVYLKLLVFQTFVSNINKKSFMVDFWGIVDSDIWRYATQNYRLATVFLRVSTTFFIIWFSCSKEIITWHKPRSNYTVYTYKCIITYN